VLRLSLPNRDNGASDHTYRVPFIATHILPFIRPIFYEFCSHTHYASTSLSKLYRYHTCLLRANVRPPTLSTLLRAVNLLRRHVALVQPFVSPTTKLPGMSARRPSSTFPLATSARGESRLRRTFNPNQPVRWTK